MRERAQKLILPALRRAFVPATRGDRCAATTIIGLLLAIEVARPAGAAELVRRAIPPRPAPLQRRFPEPILPDDAIETAIVAPAATDTLAAAIASAYTSNPTLQSQRYQLRATDDQLGEALSALRPTAEIQISGGYDRTNPGAAALSRRTVKQNDLTAQLIVDQPIYTGGRAAADIRAARADIEAGRARLRVTEGDLLLQVIAAYVDVDRDSRSLAIRERNVAALQTMLDEITARREAGQLTRTDIAQAQLQLESARAQLNLTRQQHEEDRATYAALVGRDAGVLADAPTLPLLPATIDGAFDAAERMNPDLAQAVSIERASRARIVAARAEGLPTLSLRGTAGVGGPVSPLVFDNDERSVSGRGTLTIPLAAGGRVRSRIARASDLNAADRLDIEAAQRQVLQRIVVAWNQMVTAARNVDVQASQLRAARVFYEGTLAEYRAGLRSTFDVLYAQSSYRDVQVGLISSRRDLYVAQAALLRQVGSLEVVKLLQTDMLYDPLPHARVAARRGAWPWDTLTRGIDTALAPRAQPTVITQPAAPTGVPSFAASGASSRPAPDLVTITPPVPAAGAAPQQKRPDRDAR